MILNYSCDPARDTCCLGGSSLCISFNQFHFRKGDVAQESLPKYTSLLFGSNFMFFIRAYGIIEFSRPETTAHGACFSGPDLYSPIWNFPTGYTFDVFLKAGHGPPRSTISSGV